MKTPREIILERHHAAEQKLEGINPTELASLAVAGTGTSLRARIAAGLQSAMDGFWHQAILPWRPAWAGLAAVWICIAIFNHASEAPATHAISESVAMRNPQVLSALREQNEMLVQLLEPFAAPEPENLTPNHSGPRSEQRRELFIA